MRNTIAVAGNMIIDKIKLLRTFPARHELTGILSVEESLGGAACNVGMDLARLDPSLPVRVFGVAGADADGDKVLRAFGAFPNIDTSRVRRRGQSSFTDVLTEERGRARTFLTFGGSNADFRETDVEADALSDVKLFHIGYILLLDALDAPDDEYGTKMARLLHNVQAAGALTSVDVVSEAGDRFQRLVPPALKYTDYLIVNEIEAGKTAGLALRAPGGEIDEESVWEALRAIRRMGVSRWIVVAPPPGAGGGGAHASAVFFGPAARPPGDYSGARGGGARRAMRRRGGSRGRGVPAPEGAWGLDENDREVFVRSAKLPQGYIQGTVGAGDAFCAGALLGAYRGEALKDALWYGAVAAACSLGKPGATEGVRKMEEALNAFERV